MILLSSLIRLDRHLPLLKQSWREWLAKNVWWMTLVVAIVTMLIFVGSVLLIVLLQYAIESLLFEAARPAGWLFLSVFIINTIIQIISIVLLFVAVKPLRHRLYRGWKIIYVTVLLSILANIVLPLVNGSFGLLLLRRAHNTSFVFDVASLIESIVVLTVLLYLILQIRTKFQED